MIAAHLRSVIAVSMTGWTLLVPVAASADALENAYFVCDVFEKTGISTECQIEHVVHQIDVTVDTSPTDAQNICTVITQRLADKKRYFGGDWKMRVLAPDQAAPLVVCPLR